MVVGTADGNVTHLNSSGTTLWTVPSGDPVSAVGIADDGNGIVAGTGDRLMMLDAGGHVIWTVDAKSRTLGAGISPDGNHCAAGTIAGDLLVTDNRGGVLQKILLESAVNTVAVGSEGKFVTAGTENGTIRLLGAEGDVLWTHDAGSAVQSVSMTGDGTIIGAGTGGGAVVMLDGEGKGGTVWTAASAANAVHLDADGSTLGTGTSGGYAYLMNGAGLRTWQYGRMKNIDGKNCAVTGIALSASADYLVIGSDNRNVYYFAFTSRLPPTVMKEPEPAAPPSAGEGAHASMRTTPAAGVAVAEALTPQEAPGFCAAACLGALAVVAASRRRGR
nr:PQQ-binding-like beta-propeller repeat protein [Methanoculleus sp. MH98A]